MRHSLAQLLASPSGSGTPRLEPGASSSSSPSPCSFPESPEEAEPRHEAAFLDDNELELELELLEALVDYPDLPTSKASSSSRPSHRLKAAAAARLNRQKKKQYVSGLETRLQSLAEENRRLRERNRGLGRRLRDLERETGYLRAVLANQSALGRLLGRLAGGAGLRIRSSLFEEEEEEEGERPFWESSDHDYALPVPEEEEEEDKMGAASVSSPSSYSSGICLHVDQDQVSVEFCSVCSRRAAAAPSSSLAASSATASSSSSSFFASKM